MCCNCSLTHKINRLHERCQRVIYSGKKSRFDELLDRDESASIHHQNTPKLGLKMLKVLNGENPQILNEIFRIRDEASYEPRQKSCFHIPSVNTFFRVREISGPRSFSVRKSGTYIKWYQGPLKSKVFQKSNKEMETNIMPMQNLSMVSIVLDFCNKCLLKEFIYFLLQKWILDIRNI